MNCYITKHVSTENLGHDKGISRARWINETQIKILGPNSKATFLSKILDQELHYENDEISLFYDK